MLLRFIGRVSLFCLRVFERLWGLRRDLFWCLEVEGDRIVIKPLDLWERVWKCCSGNAEEAERELDSEEREYWVRREM